jgi:caffeoyl-CoA O-methyltransferase
MKLLKENEINYFFEELISKSKEVNAYPIENNEFRFILNNFIDYLKKHNKKSLEILEIGGGIGSFTFRFAFELAKKGFIVNYFVIEKCEKKIKLFKEYLKQFKNLIKKNEKNMSKLLEIRILKGDALDILNDLLKIKKNFDFVLIDANKKKYKEYFLLSLKLTKFIVIDDIFFKAKNKRTKSIEDYLKNFLNYLESIKEKSNLSLRYLKEGSGLVIVEKIK